MTDPDAWAVVAPAGRGHTIAPSRKSPRAALYAVAAIFFVNGATAASWFPRLPEVRERLGVSDAGLGFTLVGMGLGGLVVSTFSGKAVDRFGSRQVAVTTSIVLSACSPLLGIAGTPVLFFAALISIGAFDGLTDVAMNAQAVVVEDELRKDRPDRHVMSRLHGMWSLGTVVGGVISAQAARHDVSMRLQLSITAAVTIAIAVVASFYLLPDAPRAAANVPTADQAKAARRQSFGAVGLIAMIGTAIALAEAPPFDWSSIMWRDHYDLSKGDAAFAYVAITAGMVVGRFSGDIVTRRVGTERARRGGALVAAAGVALGTLSPVHLPWSALGLFVAGLGVSLLFPLMFATAGRVLGSGGMAALSVGARFGFLVAPPLIGGLSGLTSVAVAVLLVSGTAAVVSAFAPLPRAKARTVC